MISNRFIKNEPLSKYTNFRIGGLAKYFFEAKTANEIIEAVRWVQDNREQSFVIGGGSNVLLSDDGFDGLVIKAANRGIKINGLRVTAEAGALSALVARKTVDVGLTGFEWAISLPGTIGGAIRGNAGCFGGEIKKVVSRVKILAPQEQFANSRELTNYNWGWKAREINNLDCAFNYRNSIFKQMKPAPIILSIELELQKDDPKKCLERIRENLALRKAKQPLDGSSAGCIFKNYELSPDVKPARGGPKRWEIKNHGFSFEIPKEFLDQEIIPVGWLVEQAGLLGLKLGDAEVSTKHGNFVLNRGRARAQDVVDLVQKIKQAVFQKFGIELEEEIQLVGF